MKKILFGFIFIFLFQSLTYAEITNDDNLKSENIKLPKIPIYFESNFQDFKSNDIFIKVNKSEDSFYKARMQLRETKSKTRYSDDLSKDLALGMLLGGSLGICIDFFIAYAESEKHWDDENWEETTKVGPYFKLTWTALGTIIGVPIGFARTKKVTYNYLDIYSLELYNKDLIKATTIKVPYNEDLCPEIVSNFIIDSDKKIADYNRISSAVKKYNLKPNFSEINDKYRKLLSEFGWSKGEFETTIEYERRLSEEKIQVDEIQAEWKQVLKLAENSYKDYRMKLLKPIKTDIKDLTFTKYYDFTKSKYNADRQLYTFIINKEKRNMNIPIEKAEMFNDNINNYLIKKEFKPSFDSSWSSVYDDYLLVNTKTEEIIPWEGKIQSFVESTPITPPSLTATLKLIEPSGEGYLDAGETAIIQVTINNSGLGDAKKIRISLIQRKGSALFYDVSNSINNIQNGDSVLVKFKIDIPDKIDNGIAEFEISFIEEQGFEPAPLTFTAQTRAMLKPNLQIADFGVDDANKDGKISKGESAEITLRIQNKGQGNAKNISIDIIEDRFSNVFIISEKHFDLGFLNTGEVKDVSFTISSNKRVENIVSINININEERMHFSKETKIILEFEKTQSQLEPIVFVGSDKEKEIISITGLSIDIEQNIPKSNKSNKNALAIIFGIENYRNVSNVNFAYRDATTMKEYFLKTIGIPEDQIYFRANDEVTLGEFRKIFSDNGWLDKRVIENETEIYFYYAGHGAPAIKEEKAFLIPFDGDPNYPVQTGYSLETIFENLSKLNANSVTVFLDACFTGANRENEMLLADARPVSIQLKNNYVNYVTVFSATSSNEISSSYPQNKHGLFSYFLMKGMQGKADKNNDRKLTIQELFDFIKTNVSRTAGTLDREQTPQLECLEPEKIIINY